MAAETAENGNKRSHDAPDEQAKDDSCSPWLEDLRTSDGKQKTEQASISDLPSLKLIDSAKGERSTKELVDDYLALHAVSREYDFDKNGVISRTEVERHYRATENRLLPEKSAAFQHLLDNFDRLAKGNPDGIHIADLREQKNALREKALLQTVKDLENGSGEVDRRLSVAFSPEYLWQDRQKVLGPTLPERINKALEEQGSSARIDVYFRPYTQRRTDLPSDMGYIRIKDANGRTMHTIQGRSPLMDNYSIAPRQR